MLAILGTATVLHADDNVAPTAAAASTSSTQNAVELQARASTIMGDGQVALATVTNLREQARRQQDVIKLTCVNNKLIQLKALLNMADEENQDLQVALAGGRGDGQATFDTLSNTAHEIQQDVDAAKACVGQTELYKQESGVLVSHPAFPDEPTPIPAYGEGEIEPPAYASPFI